MERAETPSSAAVSDDGLEVRTARPDDLPAILALVRQSLGEGQIPRDARFWRWKHEENPFGRSPMLIAESGEQMVGLRVFLRWTWRSGRDDVRAVRAVDTATHPAFQGRGIFRRLTLRLLEEMRHDGVAFVFNTPNAKSRPGYLKMGWSDVGRVPLFVRPRRPIALVGAKLLGREETGEETDAEGRAGLRALLDDPRLSSFLEAVSAEDERYRTPRSAAFLAWRYRDIPGFHYGSIFDLGTRSGAALLYRLRERRGLVELTILDVLAHPRGLGVALAGKLLHKLALETRAHYLVATAAPKTREAAALVLGGFVPIGARGPWLTAREIGSAPRSPLVSSSWRLSIGDLELF